MFDPPLRTPVALIIFKRPETTAKVLEMIRLARPSQLFVIADGARPEYPGETEKCAETQAVIEQIDWNCEVLKNYATVNLGCGRRLPTGLDWVFSQVEEAIVLEDDCVPHLTFFRFCEELLQRYRHDSRITSISGQNVQLEQSHIHHSYYFSRYNHCWGWATWKRAWQHFDFDLAAWPEVQQQNLLYDILKDADAVKYWSQKFQEIYEGQVTTVWDFQWTLACWLQNGSGILPRANLVSNIGIGADSTHFTNARPDPHVNLPTQSMKFPLQHPPFVVQNTTADDITHRLLFRPPLLKRAQMKLERQWDQLLKSSSKRDVLTSL
ncbi:MAG: glycosyltransferase family 2 protein [Timaviella obliquedivisa GSE-PSE-MK23-08B]|jgi:hypothetical protein|nr:glycosyltransferase family 2 protein [Timaviella obliquedivisa GSE-PSE-MK23-08B]